MMIKRSNRRRESGIGILEVALVFMVATLIVVSAFYISSVGLGTARSNQVVHEVEKIEGVVSEVFAGKVDYSGLTSSKLVSSGLVPHEMISGSDIVSSIGSSVDVGETLYEGMSTFHIGIEDVKVDQCIKLAGASFGRSHFETRVKGSSTTKLSGADAAKISNACSSSASNLSVIYLFM